MLPKPTSCACRPCNGDVYEPMEHGPDVLIASGDCCIDEPYLSIFEIGQYIGSNRRFITAGSEFLDYRPVSFRNASGFNNMAVTVSVTVFPCPMNETWQATDDMRIGRVNVILIGCTRYKPVHEYF